MTSATGFIDEPDTIRNEVMDNNLLMSDKSLTDRLRAMLDKCGVKWTDESNGYVNVTTYIAHGVEYTIIAKSYLAPEHD